MRISIRHETRYEYQEPATSAVIRLRLMPPNTSAQTVHNWAVSVNETPIERWISGAYGDAEALWRGSGRLSNIQIVAEGDVSTIDTAGVSRRAQATMRPLLFLRDTALTKPSEALKALAQDVCKPASALESMHRLCSAVHEAIQFKPGSTTFATTASEAMEHGVGVCQDQAHVFIAAARLLGIPARYVTGYLRDPDRPDNDHDPHAWTEAWVEELGWVAFDCSLGHCPVEGHVSLTVGLDAQDAAPIRAVVSHGGGVELSSDVQIAASPLDQQVQTQTQQ